MSSLLPANATAAERALSTAISEALAIGAPLRDVWNPDTCPPHMLPWLAWAFSVDQWDSTWTVAQQRAFIKQSVEVHRHKGTVGAVRDALEALGLGIQLQEWFNQSPPGEPFTFKALLSVDQEGVPQAATGRIFDVIERTKNLRSHLSGVEISMRSEAGPTLAAVTGLGQNICLTNYQSS